MAAVFDARSITWVTPRFRNGKRGCNVFLRIGSILGEFSRRGKGVQLAFLNIGIDFVQVLWPYSYPHVPCHQRSWHGAIPLVFIVESPSSRLL